MKTKSEAKHTPTPYRIGKIEGTDTWTVGKDNSLTEVFYFDRIEDAILKLAELRGPEFIVRAVNAYEKDQETIKALVEASKDAIEALRKIDPYLANNLDKAIAKTEGAKQWKL